MILREIVHTCSNAHVARAALASIGGDFAQQFAVFASHRNISAGVLAARMVKEFSTKAADEEWDGVDEVVREGARSAHPVGAALHSFARLARLERPIVVE